MFSRAIKIFTLQGFDIKIDPSWLLIAALITWTLSRQYFPRNVPDLTQGTYLAMGLLAMLAFFGSLLLHELAHSFVARRYNVQISSITLFLFGGVAELEDEPKTAGVEFWIALAGPAMSLCLAASFAFLGWLGRLTGLHVAATEVLSYLGAINLVLAIFNLIPAFPLDGGRVLRAYLWGRHGDILKATATAARAGRIFAYILMTFGFLMLFGGQMLGGLWQVFIGGFLLVAARAGYQQQLLKTSFKGKTVTAIMIKDPVIVDPDLTLSALVERIMLRHHLSFIPVVERGVLLGFVDTRVLKSIDRENWSNTKVGDVFISPDDSNRVSPDMPVKDLMALITTSGRRKYLVSEGSRLLGVISLSDLIGYIALFQDLQTGTRTA